LTLPVDSKAPEIHDHFIANQIKRHDVQETQSQGQGPRLTSVAAKEIFEQKLTMLHPRLPITKVRILFWA